ncbi:MULTISPECIES: transglycosylase domain-containing protein [Exiguobacterium]|uniref:transglycosylase domain-containing protein n=1 Tax=Exiguobacterium TaxID=33986 RepID=UPI0006821695|nr:MULTISPECIES: transglycosylase domain-containing protein [Exiguobacterium]KNH36050.1 glycosyl transferase [Exiguobacterium acetylicum]OAI87950.1 glycosyl transferase [Exiguobacterium sp. KKBO11]
MRITTGYLVLLGLTMMLLFSLFSIKDELKTARTLFFWADEQTTRHPLTSYQPITVTYENKRVELYDGLRRDDLTPRTLPKKVEQAFVAIEDQRFYQHDGYDITGILRAFTKNQSDSKSQGGSTITQQLARMTYLTNEKTYTRKIKELLIAVSLEQKYSKKELMTAYVNQAYFANNIYGIELAAKSYFNKPARELSWSEISFLTAIPNNPSLYDPLRFPENTKKRQQRIVQALIRDRVLTKDFAISRVSPRSYKPSVPYPDYIDATVQAAVRMTAQKKGWSEKHAAEYLHQQGAVISTYLDSAEQRRAKEALRNLPNPIEGAYVGIDGQTHGVTALVGYKSNLTGQFNRAVQSYRQPGSAIKPLLVYGPYLEKTKARLSSTLDGSPVCIDGYCPSNSGNRILGQVTIADAIAYSYNTPAIRAFAVSFREGLKSIRPFQFSQWTREDDAFTSALGGLQYGISPYELTNAYSVFVNDGIYRPASMIKSITLKNGTVERPQEKEQRIWSSQTNRELRAGLKNVMTYGTGRKGYDSSARYIGGKTGTTNDNKDMWFVGIKNQHIGGIWLGADRPRPFPVEANATLQVQTWATILRP